MFSEICRRPLGNAIALFALLAVAGAAGTVDAFLLSNSTFAAGSAAMAIMAAIGCRQLVLLRREIEDVESVLEENRRAKSAG